jgi:hypothetical protein
MSYYSVQQLYADPLTFTSYFLIVAILSYNRLNNSFLYLFNIFNNEQYAHNLEHRMYVRYFEIWQEYIQQIVVFLTEFYQRGYG